VSSSVTITTEPFSDGLFSTYQVYETDWDFNPGNLLESGIEVAGERMIDRQYDHQEGLIYAYDATDPNVVNVFEMNREGERGELLQYIDQREGEGFELEVAYDADSHSVVITPMKIFTTSLYRNATKTT